MQVIAKRRARGWTVVVMGDDGTKTQACDLQRWIYHNGLGCTADCNPSDLVKEVCQLEGWVKALVCGKLRLVVTCDD